MCLLRTPARLQVGTALVQAPNVSNSKLRFVAAVFRYQRNTHAQENIPHAKRKNSTYHVRDTTLHYELKGFPRFKT